MTDDATLSDFDSAVDRAETGDTADRQADSSEDDGEPMSKATAPEDSAEAAESGRLSRDSELSTYAWGTYACGRCETDTGRVWREDGEFVCPDCKPW
ncbi:DUF7573 domain-containing protein [Natronorubrum halophilum]|uniref:DUF7573 domain-containing protein n=1 Tax=Natronorubrum halophilum TaxID=1702106 RepID=UPI000EF6B66D|nr:hypothetical protein [Natronorubrum halophilum]